MPYNTNNDTPPRRYVIRKKRKKKKKRIALLFVTMFLFSIIGYAGFVIYNTYAAFNDTYADGREKSALRDEQVKVSDDPFSVLLLGIEDYSGEHDRGRSDTIMVATFNPKTDNMKLLSIPRDTLVDLPGRVNQDKINHAYADGGRDETIETVEKFLNIPIDYYALVNFKGFTKVIDEVGGVTVDVPFDFKDIDKDWNHYSFKEGKQTLNGDEALVYSRMRKKDPRGDFGRNMRQRQVVTGLIDELSSPKTLLKIDDIAEVAGKNIQTNMSIGEAMGLSKNLTNFNKSKIEQLEIKGEDDYENGVYYFKPDEEEVAQVTHTLRSHLDLPTEEEETTDSSSDSESYDESTYDSDSQ
ncbi:LCP family protein [Bacillus sp. V5-8f]|uniref:LCP family protein n=1 Tax=Bacillus sp. V5-8f TaxID=2053044 RepID=UPI000C785443|nr:LCP family protein [Bacillus sp. V5-8f]PLT35719.1 LytR family transcriptional regulator [Bacillus sp. V5-8f]